MTVLQQPDAQIEEVTESASFVAENCLGMIELATGFKPDLPLASYPRPETTQNSFQDGGSLELPAHTSPHDFQLSEYGIFNATFDPPMSFRDRHRFLDGIYNSYPDPTLITAEDMGEVARKVGLLMEEVLAWFKDEKLRRAELLANNRHQAQVSTCQFPPSPESTRASGEVSSASSSYNSTSPGTPSQPLVAFSPCPTSTEDKKMLAPPKSKRGRPAKTHIKTEPDLPSPDAKRKKMSMKYPCPDCRNFVPSERYAEHINRKHFPEYVWECPKINQQTGKPCSSNPHYRPFYRLDNFATHLKGEHDCSDPEVVELKKSCKFEVMDFFHKICGFCDKKLASRDESIEHVKEHFRQTSQEPNPPTDLDVSLWKEKCGSEHKLQLGVHYRRSQASKPSLINVDHDHDHDGHNGEDGGSGEGNSDNSGHDSLDFPPDNSTHDRGNDGGRHSGEGCPDSQSRDNPESRPNDSNNNHDYDRSEDRRSGEDCSGVPSYSESVDATFYQDQPSMRWPKMQNPLDLPANSSLPIPHYGKRSENQERASSSLPRRPSAVPSTRTRKLTSKEDVNFQCHVKGCGKLFGRSYNFKAHMESHDAIREYLFPCTFKDCNKTFLRETDLQRHNDIVHMKQRNHRCDYCSRFFMRKDTLRRHMEDGCSKRFDIEIPNTVSIADTTYHMLLRHMHNDNEDVEFLSSAPQSSNHEAYFYPKSQEGCPTSSVSPYAEASPYNMEPPELRAPSNYSTASGPSAVSSATDSPYSIRTPQFGMESPELRVPSKYSVASGPSAISPAMGSPYSIRGHTVPLPEWCPSGLGLNPSIVDYDDVKMGEEYSFVPVGMDEFALDAFNPTKPNRFVDSYILRPQYTGRPTSAVQSNHSSYPYPSPSLTPHQSYSSQDNFSSEESTEKGRCTYPDCGKVFKDLKAHMVTHANERPEKCPIQTCDYHIKGFARKYDKNRHTLTHYKGTMVCGFCPGSGSAAEKSFNRADVFKRHLTSVHAVSQTPPNSRKKISAAGNVNSVKKLSGYAPDATGKCSTCSETFSNAQDFYEHLDDCVLRIVQQEEPSEAINAARLAEVENDHSSHETLRNNAPSMTIKAHSTDEDGDDQLTDNDDDYTSSRKGRRNDRQKPLGLTHTKSSLPLKTKGEEKRKDYPSSWGFDPSLMKIKKRILCAFDGPRLLWKDDLMLDGDYEVRMNLSDGDAKTYVTDLDVQTMQRADAFHNSAQDKKGPWIADDTPDDLEKLMEVKRESTAPAIQSGQSHSVEERPSKNEAGSEHPTNVFPEEMRSAQTDTAKWQTSSAIEVL